MLAPHAVDIAVTISSLIASLCFTFAEPGIRRHFSLRQVKLCIGQRKYKQKFTTQGSTDRPTERPSEWIRAHSLNSYFVFCKIVVKTTKSPRIAHMLSLISQRGGFSKIRFPAIVEEVSKMLHFFRPFQTMFFEKQPTEMLQKKYLLRFGDLFSLKFAC